MVEEAFAGIGQVVFGEGHVQLTAVGLGSCVGVLIYDKDKPVAGLAHVMLPEIENENQFADKPLETKLKFATIAVPYLINRLTSKYRSNKKNLLAKIVGGAQMFPSLASSAANVGLRNQELVRQLLQEEGIIIEAEDVGGSKGRSLRFMVDTKELTIKSANGEHLL